VCGTQLHCALSRHNAHASERGSVQPGGHRQADASLAGWSGALNRTNGPSVLGHERLAKFVNEHLQPEGTRAAHAVTKIVQGWPKSWANFEALIGIFSQSVGPSLAIWVNPVQFSFVGRAVVHRRGGSSKIIMSIRLCATFEHARPPVPPQPLPARAQGGVLPARSAALPEAGVLLCHGRPGPRVRSYCRFIRSIIKGH
jgi:hypothetical protein